MSVPEPKWPDPGIPENQVPLLYDGPWYAKVTPEGRWRYRIKFVHGGEPLMESYDATFAFGSRTHADNKARRGLNRRNRPQEDVGEWTIGRH